LPQRCGQLIRATRIFGAPTARTLNDYGTVATKYFWLLDEYVDAVDAHADEVGRFFDHLRQVGIGGLHRQANDG
jgi:hypothetical protein